MVTFLVGFLCIHHVTLAEGSFLWITWRVNMDDRTMFEFVTNSMELCIGTDAISVVYVLRSECDQYDFDPMLLFFGHAFLCTREPYTVNHARSFANRS